MEYKIYIIHIDKCNNPGYWYSRYVGQIFYAGEFKYGGTDYFKIVSDRLNKGKLCSMRDATIIEQVTKVELHAREYNHD